MAEERTLSPGTVDPYLVPTEIFDTVYSGRGINMLSYKNRLSKEQIIAVSRYILDVD